MRPRRSVLYIPASNARALDKARVLPADALILDLEDAVAPQAKAEARQTLAAALRTGGYGHRELIVRVNALETPWGGDDLACVAGLPADAVLFPKVSTRRQLDAAVAALEAAGTPADLPVWAMAETALGIVNIADIAAHPRLRVLVLGTSDLAKELRVPQRPGRPGLLPALSQCVLAARAHGLDVLDGVYLALTDDAGLAAACAQGRALGFDGKTLIHPRQIDAANAAFSPTPGELAEAREIIAAWQRAQAEGRGVLVVNGRLVEALHVEEAQRLVALAEATRSPD